MSRRRVSAAARARPFWILWLLLAALIGAAAYYALTWPGFFPKPVSVAGNRRVSTQRILARAKIAPRENIWLQNMGAAAARVREIPYIAAVAIHRTLPAAVYIEVTERVPYARLEAGTRIVLIDRELRVLQPAPPASALPLIAAKDRALPAEGSFVRDPDAVNLLADYGALSAAHVAVASLAYDRFGDLEAVTRQGIRLKLGDEADLARIAPLVDPIISQVSASGRRLAAVDLRAPKTPVVEYK
jgi:cell division septal protein FtsQ